MHFLNSLKRFLVLLLFQVEHRTFVLQAHFKGLFPAAPVSATQVIAGDVMQCLVSPQFGVLQTQTFQLRLKVAKVGCQFFRLIIAQHPSLCAHPPTSWKQCLEYVHLRWLGSAKKEIPVRHFSSLPELRGPRSSWRFCGVVVSSSMTMKRTYAWRLNGALLTSVALHGFGGSMEVLLAVMPF